VAAEFAALAGLLDSATDAQRDTPSLCEERRVHEVIAHMTMAPARRTAQLPTVWNRRSGRSTGLGIGSQSVTSAGQR
jgi:hypothetical protein